LVIVIQVKERLFHFNYEILSQLDITERKEKLTETYQNVEGDYKRIMGSLRTEAEGDIWEWIDLGDDDEEEVDEQA
jgi:hypothetical protein